MLLFFYDSIIHNTTMLIKGKFNIINTHNNMIDFIIFKYFDKQWLIP